MNPNRNRLAVLAVMVLVAGAVAGILAARPSLLVGASPPASTFFPPVATTAETVASSAGTVPPTATTPPPTQSPPPPQPPVSPPVVSTSVPAPPPVDTGTTAAPASVPAPPPPTTTATTTRRPPPPEPAFVPHPAPAGRCPSGTTKQVSAGDQSVACATTSGSVVCWRVPPFSRYYAGTWPDTGRWPAAPDGRPYCPGVDPTTAGGSDG